MIGYWQDEIAYTKRLEDNIEAYSLVYRAGNMTFTMNPPMSSTYNWHKLGEMVLVASFDSAHGKGIQCYLEKPKLIVTGSDLIIQPQRKTDQITTETRPFKDVAVVKGIIPKGTFCKERLDMIFPDRFIAKDISLPFRSLWGYIKDTYRLTEDEKFRKEILEELNEDYI